MPQRTALTEANRSAHNHRTGNGNAPIPFESHGIFAKDEENKMFVSSKRQYLPSRAAWIGMALSLSSLFASPLLVLRAQNPNTQNPSTQNPNAGAPAATQTFSSGDVELQHSRVFIFVGKRGAGHEHAIEGRLQKGKLLVNQPSEREGQMGELVFDMSSFDADTDVARKYIGLEGSIDESTRKAVNENMLGKGVLDVKRFPQATFVATKIVATGNKSKRGLPEIKVIGNFTLHGETRPVEFLADGESANGWIRVRGSFSILQTDYGIKPFTKLLGAVGVTDKLDIYGDLFIAP